MRRSYKSFVKSLDAKRSSINNTPLLAEKNKESIQAPKKASENKKTIVVSHYDDNQPISLSLPESLCLDHKVIENSQVEDHSTINKPHQHGINNPIEDAIILSETHATTKSIEPYSDANNYFEAEDEHLKKHNHKEETLITAKSLETVTPNQDTQNNENPSQDLPNLDEINKLEDQRFEDDLRSIMEQKQPKDKQREQNNSSETEKNKDQGITNESDEAFKNKLNDRHAIFDQIAQSMQMANTYDFGAIAMNKKLDSLEEETNEDFTQKIQNLLQDDKEEDKEKPAYTSNNEDKDKILTEDFLEDINTLNALSSEQSKTHQDYAEDAFVLKDSHKLKTEAPPQTPAETSKQIKLSEQSSFNSTISIKHRYLKSRVFSATGGTVAVTIDSNWVPEGCSDLSHLNVYLTQEINWGIDDQKGTKLFRIGTSDTQTWSGLPSGNYYLTFFFANNTNPHCELQGTIHVIT
ncbi:hypothetical protein [uncultured Algibacter sp.]|uniref:hypothetical protein n=1 Tax=uncultured Algibacter sp. TaxID=298659 RepID=UPI003217835D